MAALRLAMAPSPQLTCDGALVSPAPRKQRTVRDTTLVYALIGCFIAGLPWAWVAYYACTVETNLNTVTEQPVVTIGIGLAL